MTATPSIRTVDLRPDLAITVTEAGTGRPVLILHGGGGPFTVAGIADHLAETTHTMTPTHLAGTAPSVRTGSPASTISPWPTCTTCSKNTCMTSWSSAPPSAAGSGAEMTIRDAAGLITGLILIDAVGVEVDGEPIRDVFALDPRDLADYSFHDAARFYVDPSTVPAEQAARQQANMATMRVIAGHPYMHDPELLGRLGRIHVPTLAIWGDSDRIVTPAYGAAYAAALPSARLEIVHDAGHLPQIEQPAATFALIDRYLNDNT